jgi:hypothetical protein
VGGSVAVEEGEADDVAVLGLGVGHPGFLGWGVVRGVGQRG